MSGRALPEVTIVGYPFQPTGMAEPKNSTGNMNTKGTGRGTTGTGGKGGSGNQ